MATPCTSPALLRVLTDTSLLGHVVSFQRGLPIALFEFWCASDETIRSAAREDRNLIHARHHELLALILTCGGGAIELLDMFKAIRYTDYDHRGFLWSAPSLEGVICGAVTRHRFDLLQWAIDNGAVSDISNVGRFWTKMMNDFDDDNVGILNALIQAVPMDDKTVASVAPCIRRVASLRWLADVMPDVRFPSTIMYDAVRRGDLVMVRFLCEHRAFDGSMRTAINDALTRNHAAILECLLANRMDTLDWRDAVALLKKSRGKLREIIKRFASTFPPIPTYYVAAKIRERDDSFVDLLIEARLLTEVLLDKDAGQGNLEHVQWIHKKGIATATTDAVDRAAERGHWHVALFLLEHRTEGCTVATLVAAVQTGDLALVRFIYKHVQKSPDNPISNITEPLDVAAANGYFPIVQFLHRSGFGCTANAVDRAMAGKHFDVVLYLLKHRSESCSMTVVREALSNDHAEVLSVLYHKHRHLFDSELLDEFVRRGVVDMTVEYPSESLDDEDPLVDDVSDPVHDQQTLELLKKWSKDIAREVSNA